MDGKQVLGGKPTQPQYTLCELLQADPQIPVSFTFNGCSPPAMRAIVLRIWTATVAFVTSLQFGSA